LWGVENASTDPEMCVVCDDCFRVLTGVLEDEGIVDRFRN
jgi:hypothetical protein